MERTCKSATNKFKSMEIIKQSQEDDMVHLMIRLLMELRVNTNEEKERICKYHLKKLENLEKEHINERESLGEWFDYIHTNKIRNLAKNIINVIQLDVNSSTYVMELYENLIIEDKSECESTFTVKQDNYVSDSYGNELKALLIKQKKEALSEINRLITLIHYVVDYQDQDSLIEAYHPFVLSSEQNKELQNLQEKYGKHGKIECIASLVSKAYYEYVNNKSRNIDVLVKRTRIITTRILMNLYVEIKNGRFSSNTDLKRNKTALFLNADLCKGLNL